MSGRYTYGDSDRAAERLVSVARIFEPTSRAFLQRSVHEVPSLALDLGCGPGLTTRLLHETTGSRHTVGLDGSESFIAGARNRTPDGVEFMVHDARVVPFPTEPADIVYCRLLLPHLVSPGEMVAAWATQVRPGGLLLLDELESVDTEEPAFVNYLDQVARKVVADEGADLYVGPGLHAMDDPPGTQRIADEVVTFTPEAVATARIFSMNLAELTEPGTVDARPDLAAPLKAVAQGGVARPATWRVRQLAFRSLRSVDR